MIEFKIFYKRLSGKIEAKSETGSGLHSFGKVSCEIAGIGIQHLILPRIKMKPPSHQPLSGLLWGLTYWHTHVQQWLPPSRESRLLRLVPALSVHGSSVWCITMSTIHIPSSPTYVSYGWWCKSCLTLMTINYGSYGVFLVSCLATDVRQVVMFYPPPATHRKKNPKP